MSLGCHSKSHKLGDLKQWNFSLFSRPEAKARLVTPLRGSRGDSAGCHFQPLVALAFFGPRVFPPVSVSISTWPFLCLSPSVCVFSFVRTLAIGFGAYLDNKGCSHFENLKLITSAKTLFPNKVTCVGSRWTSLLGATFQATTVS